MYSGAAEWLKNHHLAKNNLAAALEMAPTFPSDIKHGPM
jgi:hypothetical protein